MGITKVFGSPLFLAYFYKFFPNKNSHKYNKNSSVYKILLLKKSCTRKCTLHTAKPSVYKGLFDRTPPKMPCIYWLHCYPAHDFAHGLNRNAFKHMAFSLFEIFLLFSNILNIVCVMCVVNFCRVANNAPGFSGRNTIIS